MSSDQAADLADFEDFFRVGEEGTYEGGPATLPPPPEQPLQLRAAEAQVADGNVEERAAAVLDDARARRKRLGRLVSYTMLGLTLFTGVALVVAARRREAPLTAALHVPQTHAPALGAALVSAREEAAAPKPAPVAEPAEPVAPEPSAVAAESAAPSPAEPEPRPMMAAVSPVAAEHEPAAPAARSVAERAPSAARRARATSVRAPAVAAAVAAAVTPAAPAPAQVAFHGLPPAKASGQAVAGFKLVAPPAPRAPTAATAPARSEAALARFPDAR